MLIVACCPWAHRRCTRTFAATALANCHSFRRMIGLGGVWISGWCRGREVGKPPPLACVTHHLPSVRPQYLTELGQQLPQPNEAPGLPRGRLESVSGQQFRYRWGGEPAACSRTVLLSLLACATALSSEA